ncbi:MAG: EipB family protein [Candidatus Puniceispirillales bacterium]
MTDFNPWARIGTVLVMTLAVFASAEAGQFASHRATYDLELRQASSGSTIQAIEGRTVFSLKRFCDGWQSVEDYAITFSFDQATSNFISHYETWESLTGNAFSFSVLENSTSAGPAEHNGFANLSDGQGEAWFLDGDDTASPLPEGTQFPVNHLKTVLDGAARGEMITSGTLFLGGERDDALYYVSSIIGKATKQEADPIMGTLGQSEYRPLSIAYYKPDARDPIPDYSIEFMLQDNGVIRQYIVDYGDFTMRATLSDITALEEPAC